MKLTIGTRGSQLALWQAHFIQRTLLALPEVDVVEICVIKTTGDRIQNVALSEVGGKGLFVKEIEEALIDGRVDLAVHSLKDVPSILPTGLALSAIPERANPRDAWVRPLGAPPASFVELSLGARVGTSSLRRSSQLLAARPDLEIIPIRGNVDTRLRKLDDGTESLSAIILACAGLQRLGLGERVSEALSPTVMLPAVGQGALAIESRTDDDATNGVLSALHDPDTADCTTSERALLRCLEGSCQVPIAGYATIGDDDQLTLQGLIAHPSGEPVLRWEIAGPRADAARLGTTLGEQLLAAGGRAILNDLAT